jgi:hypothetical protein
VTDGHLAIKHWMWTGKANNPCTSLDRPLAYECGKVVSPRHRSPLPRRKYSWYSCLLRYAVAQLAEACATSRKVGGSIPDGVIRIIL